MSRPYNEFHTILIDHVKLIMGNNWVINPKTEISDISDSGEIICNLWIQDSHNLSDLRNLNFTVNYGYGFDIPISTQLTGFVSQFKH